MADKKLVIIGVALYLIAGLYNGMPVIMTTIIAVAGAYFVIKGWKGE